MVAAVQCTHVPCGTQRAGTAPRATSASRPLQRFCNPAPVPRGPLGGAAAAAGAQRGDCVVASAGGGGRRGGRNDYPDEDVHFDDEENWEDQGSPLQGSAQPFLMAGLRSVGAVTDKLVDLALQVAPDDVSPGVVRVAVNAGLILLALSFVKSILSFFLTLGTVIFGAYVATKFFGIEIPGIGSSSGGSSGSPKQKPRKGGGKPDPRARQSEFRGLLGASQREAVDGLLDVWFERKQKPKR